jgi:hypothetical protein
MRDRLSQRVESMSGGPRGAGRLACPVATFRAGMPTAKGQCFILEFVATSKACRPGDQGRRRWCGSGEGDKTPYSTEGLGCFSNRIQIAGRGSPAGRHKTRRTRSNAGGRKLNPTRPALMPRSQRAHKARSRKTVRKRVGHWRRRPGGRKLRMQEYAILVDSIAVLTMGRPASIQASGAYR